MLHVLGLIIYLYLAVSTVYLLILGIAGRWKPADDYQLTLIKKNILILIPAFREDNIIINTVQKCLAHDYPSDHFKIVVIADSLQPPTIQQLSATSALVMVVNFEVSTKARSIHTALQEIDQKQFDIAVILDADNVMGTGCLERINCAFQQGYNAIQCHRTAKNQDTPVAQLDGISEETNINLFRRGPSALGLSAMPLGSGMAFKTSLLAGIFDTPGILDNPAEDREIEIQLMKGQHRMQFLNEAYVYDEKVGNTAGFQKQRTRWLEAQLNQVRRFFKPDMRTVTKTADYFNILLISLMLPRLLYLLIWSIVILMLVAQQMFFVNFLYPAATYWICWLAGYLVVLLISIPSKYYTTKTVKAVVHVPALMISMIKAILKLKRNRREFLHTSKTYNTK